MKIDKDALLEECRKVRERVSKYTPEQKAELSKRARDIIKKSAKKA